MALGRVPASLAGALSWFPGHMAKAQAGIAGRLPTCDLILEVRDARLPISSASSATDSLTDSRKRWLVLNKADLCGRRMLESHMERFADQGIHAVAVSAKSTTSMKQVRLCAQALLRCLNRPFEGEPSNTNSGCSAVAAD
jgi:ribosome biogenesis GTPase A